MFAGPINLGELVNSHINPLYFCAIKSLIKRFFSRLALMGGSSTNEPSPTFKTYADALAYCNSKTQGSYESALLSRYRFDKFSKFLTSGGSLFESPSASLLLFAVSLFLSRENRTHYLIDFGGACGESVFLLSKIFGDQIFERAFVCESPQQVREASNWSYVSQIKFIDDLERALATPIDLFFTSGTIQSLPNPYDALNAVAKAGVSIVALTRNNFSLNPTIVAQQSMLSANGTGTHLPEYENPVMFYPNQSIDKHKLITIFRDHNYSLFLDTTGTTSGVYGSACFSGDLIFSRPY